MEQEINELKVEVAKCNQDGKLCSRDSNLALKIYSYQQKRGIKLTKLAEELGLRDFRQLIQQVKLAKRKLKPKVILPAKLRPVQVISQKTEDDFDSIIEILSPQGYRIRAGSVKTAARFMRELEHVQF